MARCSAPLAFVALLAVVLVVVPPMADAITCGQVVSLLTPCVTYARAGGPIPPGCCSGVRRLVSTARSTPDRQTACTCLKKAANSFSGLRPGLIAGVPGKCGVRVPYAISPSTDCSKVK